MPSKGQGRAVTRLAISTMRLALLCLGLALLASLSSSQTTVIFDAVSRHPKSTHIEEARIFSIVGLAGITAAQFTKPFESAFKAPTVSWYVNADFLFLQTAVLQGLDTWTSFDNLPHHQACVNASYTPYVNISGTLLPLHFIWWGLRRC